MFHKTLAITSDTKGFERICHPLNKQWHMQPKILDGGKILILGEEQSFVWDTASQSTK